MILFKKIIFIGFFFTLVACSSIPKNTQNSCEIFEERYLWYKHAKASHEKWGAPIHLQLAFIKKESDFNWLAKPPRRKLFKVIPFKRPSSSFGYSQAVEGTVDSRYYVKSKKCRKYHPSKYCNSNSESTCCTRSKTYY